MNARARADVSFSTSSIPSGDDSAAVAAVSVMILGSSSTDSNFDPRRVLLSSRRLDSMLLLSSYGAPSEDTRGKYSSPNRLSTANPVATAEGETLKVSETAKKFKPPGQ